MISLSKIANTGQNLTKVSLTKPIPPNTAVLKTQSSCNLNLSPHSYCIPSNIFNKAKQTLIEFQEDLGDIKSSTLICEKIKQAQRRGGGRTLI